jgi:ectoine hydroxylase-related dioxygenase (phytanoyl-CoA dioxygenase family)
MAAEDILSYGVVDARTVENDVDAHVEELDYLGYTVVESGMSVASLDRVRASIDTNYERQLAETSAAGMAADADILRAPLVYDDVFVEVATLEPLMAICRRALGPNLVLLQQNAIINRPTTDQFQSRWHRDLTYQHFVSSKKLALNALLCVDDFTSETGGTVVLPGTHLAEAFPSSRFVRRHEVAVSAKAGSILVLDAMLFHRSGFNVSGRNRRGVNHLIGRPLLAQQIDLPAVLEGRHADDDFLRRYLGYQWNPARSVGAWRAARAQPV